MISPLLKSSLELLDHALSHLDKGHAKDLRIAVTGSDNAIELLLKEVARFKGIRIIDKNGHSISYYQAIDMLQHAGTKIPELPDIDILHAERNNIYHAGNQPSKETAAWLVLDVALSFANRFCQDELKYDITDFSDDFHTIMRMSRDIDKAREKIVARFQAKAESSYRRQDYNQALIAAYSGIEAYLGSAIPIDIRANPQMLKQLVEDQLLSEDDVKAILHLRNLRNSAVHGAGLVSSQDAKLAIEMLDSVFNAIDSVLE